MQIGKYRPLKYRKGEAYRTYQFTSIIQVWLAVLSFSLFIVTLLWGKVWWWNMIELSGLEWIAYAMGSVLVLFFVCVAIWSFVSFLIVIYRGWFGITIPYKEGALPPEIAKAVESKKPTNKDMSEIIKGIINSHINDNQYLIDLLNAMIKMEDTDNK